MKTHIHNSLFVIVIILSLPNVVFSQWINGNLPFEWTPSRVQGITLNYNRVIAGTWGSGIFISMNNGVLWKRFSLGVEQNYFINCLLVHDSILFVGTSGSGVYISTNDGNTWTQTTLNNKKIHSLISVGSRVFAGTDDAGVLMTSNDGISWEAVNTGLWNLSVWALVATGDKIYAGTMDNVFMSTNNGSSWVHINSGLTYNYIYSLVASDSFIFAGTNGGLFRSTNFGAVWKQVHSPLNNSIWTSLALHGDFILAGTNKHGVMYSTDNGINWISDNAGMTNSSVWSVAVNNMYLYAGAEDGLYRRPLKEILTNIEYIESNNSHQLFLHQNYPNPFNSITNIDFTLSKKSYTSLKIYDVIGRVVKVLYSEELSPGNYSVRLDASNYSSGIYIYELQSDNYKQLKRLILLK